MNTGSVGFVHVEIELDGVVCAKRCPAFKTPEGFQDHAAIREYFVDLGYSVGTRIRIC